MMLRPNSAAGWDDSPPSQAHSRLHSVVAAAACVHCPAQILNERQACPLHSDLTGFVGGGCPRQRLEQAAGKNMGLQYRHRRWRETRLRCLPTHPAAADSVRWQALDEGGGYCGSAPRCRTPEDDSIRKSPQPASVKTKECPDDRALQSPPHPIV